MAEGNARIDDEVYVRNGDEGEFALKIKEIEQI